MKCNYRPFPTEESPRQMRCEACGDVREPSATATRIRRDCQSAGGFEFGAVPKPPAMLHDVNCRHMRSIELVLIDAPCCGGKGTTVEEGQCEKHNLPCRLVSKDAGIKQCHGCTDREDKGV